MTPLLANTLWFLACLPESLAFHRACRDVAGTQAALLRRLLRRNAQTDLGRRYGFAAIGSAAEYQARVPCSDYEDYTEAIQRIGAGVPGVLTAEPVLLLEPTSGSSAASKHIPYTAALKAEFQRALAPWIVDLYRHEPGLLAGQAYWSVTPVLQRAARTPGGIPIGFEEESEYLGPVQGRLVRSLMAVPSEVKFVAEMETFRYLTLLFLLRSRSLALISVWNPTFLILLLEPLEAWGEALAEDIAQGTLRPPRAEAALPPALHALNPPDAARAADIRAILRATREPATRHALLWPGLRLLSCWADGYAAPYARALARLFPQATMQGKGLLATEGFVSFPLHGQTGGALALRSHFFEFLPEEEPEGTPRLAHELALGRVYSLLLTTGGGLYRYRLHDLVEVVGHLGQCPLLRFLGKAGHLSDHFGEKLDERHVRRALEAQCAAHGLAPRFAMLACEEAGPPPAYVLFIEAAGEEATLLALAEALEVALQENFHYRYCRALGQLGPLRLFRIEHGAWEAYLVTCQAHGQRVGDIKPLALHRRGGWLHAFMGALLDRP